MATETLTSRHSYNPTQWHAGNLRMQSLMAAPNVPNPTTPFLTPSRAMTVASSPLLAIGTLDSQSKPWTSLWGGERGFVGILSQTMLGISTVIDRLHDPIIETCGGRKESEEVFGGGRPMSALAIDLKTRRRVKLAGKVAGVALNGESREGAAHSQVVLELNSSLGNCPKYLNAKDVVPAIPHPKLHPESLPLSEPALSVISKADLFFMTASADGTHLSTNHRGGPRGFIRVPSNTPSLTQIAYPEYSGNRLYQTLGNLQVTPLAGIVIPDFDTGNALYATCEARILVGEEAASLMPRTNLAVVLTLKEARFVENTLGFHAADGKASPYNPPVRPLASETASGTFSAKPIATVTLAGRTSLTDDVAHLTFSTDTPVIWKRGQHAILSFEDELGLGYAHMNDEDPASLNDDLVRSFTVTTPAPPVGETVREFGLMVRKVGKVTSHLLKANIRAGTGASLIGFGGEFMIDDHADTVGFVAGGVGITPLMGQLDALRLDRVNVWWTVNARDIEMARSLAKNWKRVPATTLFLTGTVSPAQESAVKEIEETSIKVLRRRIDKEDLISSSPKVSRWYVCAGQQLKAKLEDWLRGEEITSEEFNF